MALLKDLEKATPGSQFTLSGVLDNLAYNEAGLIAAIAQEVNTREVLMLAWMDRKAIERTLSEGFACYFSRSRQAYWRKGETSGNVQAVHSMSFDCDGDAVLLQVAQTGNACHTERPHCFYLKVDGDVVTVHAEG